MIYFKYSNYVVNRILDKVRGVKISSDHTIYVMNCILVLIGFNLIKVIFRDGVSPIFKLEIPNTRQDIMRKSFNTNRLGVGVKEQVVTKVLKELWSIYE